MKAGDYYKADTFDKEREAIARQERVEQERQAALRRQKAEQAWLAEYDRRGRQIMHERHVDDEEARRLLRQDNELDRAVSFFHERLDAHKRAAYAAEHAEESTSQHPECKSAPIAIKAAAGGSLLGANGRFTSLAAVIGGAPDSYGDIILPGVFKQTIAEARAKAKPFLWPVLYQHDPTRPIGGVASAEERPGGLYVECALNLDSKDGKEAYSLINGGFLDGLSIGYQAIRDGYRGSIRELREIRLLECSIVTFPANQSAQVSRVN